MIHKARKRFGQNFLNDSTIINQIIGHIQPSENQHWVEIGPGQGALTVALLAHNICLDVVELDRDLVTILQQKFNLHSQLTVHSADALLFNFAGLAEQGEKLHIIGNLPYNISTPLLFHLLNFSHCIADMHFMLQKEVVDRICAAPGSKQYGRLSVMMQYYCQGEWLFDVPPESFSPVPKVMSAIIRLIPHVLPPVMISSMTSFSTVVSHAFSQRRKTLRNSMKNVLTEAQIVSTGINPNTRAETLNLEEFAALSNLLANCDNLSHSQGRENRLG